MAGVLPKTGFVQRLFSFVVSIWLPGREIRALVINTGIANAGTGAPGRQTAQASCRGRRSIA